MIKIEPRARGPATKPSKLTCFGGFILDPSLDPLRSVLRSADLKTLKRVGLEALIMAKKGIVLCSKKFKGRCDTHDRKCTVPVVFPFGDGRSAFVDELRRLGAGNHTKDSEHRCDLCERERQEGRRAGWYQIDPHDGVVKPQVTIKRQEDEREEKRKEIERARKERQERFDRDSQ